MKISIVSPGYGKGSTRSNTVTARRWARILRKLGNQVRVAAEFSGQNCEVLIALHAQRSRESIRVFRRKYPQHPVIVALTGMNLYQDFPRSRCLRLASLFDPTPETAA
jgi:N-acyl-L-homoserine lactone synthetase